MVTTPTRGKNAGARPTGTRTTASTAQGAATGAQQGWFARMWAFLEGRNASLQSSYYLILGSTLALVVIGLIMVFSASAVEQTAKAQDPFSQGIKQTVFALLGLVAIFVLSRLSIPWLKRLSWVLMVISFMLLALVLVIGVDIGGNQNWIQFGSFLSFQPSEIAKLALILWIATVYSRKQNLLGQWRHMLIPVVPIAVLAVALVLREHDLGTSMILLMIVGAALFFAGVPARIFVLGGSVGVVVALVMALTNSNRTGRIGAWLGKCGTADVHGYCDQAQNGLYALASGRFFGVGLGQSRQKWNWIPEAHNDFIFAIIGEELGLIGTVVVVLLYALLAIGMFRVIVRHNDLFVRIVCGSITVWIIGQAVVNIAMVIGLLPVIGVPLPFVSYGGTALTVCMGAIGVVLGFARRGPADVQAENAQAGTGPVKSRAKA